MKKTITVLAAALAVSTAVHAQGVGQVEGYAMGGFSDSSDVDSGIALKIGADFQKNLAGIKGLGLTAFVSHWSGDVDTPFGGSVDISAFVLAAGVTYDYPIPNSKFTVQGRGFAMITRATVETCVPFGFGCGKSTNTEFEPIGLGAGGSFAVNDRLSVRVNYDMLDDADIITAGVGYKF